MKRDVPAAGGVWAAGEIAGLVRYAGGVPDKPDVLLPRRVCYGIIASTISPKGPFPPSLGISQRPQ